MPSCTGCTVVLNNSLSLTHATNTWLTGYSNVPVYGSGVGQFSGVSGFLLGNITIQYSGATQGACSGRNGSLEIIAATGTGLWTGFFTYDANRYICTGSSVCSIYLKESFTANPLLSGISPNYSIFITHLDSEQRFAAGKISASSPTYNFSSNYYSADCGFQDYIANSVRFVLSPYSGYIGAEVQTTINCGPCLSGA